MDTSRSYPVSLPDVQWRQKLSDLEYHVLREAGTERPFTGEYTDTTTEGVYSCRACGTAIPSASWWTGACACR